MTNPQNQNSSAVRDLYRIVNEKFKMFMPNTGIRFRPSSDDNDNAVCKATVSFLLCTLN